jgi:hypothetical protein
MHLMKKDKTMNKLNIFKKASIGFTALVAGLLISGGTVSAIPYTGDTTVASPVPAFNVFTGNMPAPAPTSGEPDFFQGRVPSNGNLKDPSTPFTDPVSTNCTNGEIIQLHVYVHNGASADNNGNGSGPSVAHGSRVRVSLSDAQATSFDPTATLSANNAATVTDGVTINCNGQSVKLQYVSGSASQFSNGSGVLPLSDSIVSSGAPIQSEKVPGDVWGCWNERVYVVLAVKVVNVPTPPPPAFMCTTLGLEADANRKVKLNAFSTTATNGATFKDAVIDWGDNSAPLTTGTVIGQTHQYSKDGTYIVSAVAHFTVNDQDITSGGPQCQKQVTFSSNVPPIVTPPTTTPPTTPTPAAPTALVNTGPGSVVGLFAATTAIGAVAHRWMLGRRLSRQ